LWGTAVVTKENGTFTLEAVPTGTQLIIVRRLGFAVARVNVNVTSRQPTELRVALGPTVNLLDPVLVTARANYALEKNGFAARQRNGWGKYYTREEIRKRNPAYLSDLLTDVPGLRVAHSLGGASIQAGSVRSILGGGVGGCPHIWVDGFEWRVTEPGEIDSFVFPRDIIGLEVYRPREAPVRYLPNDDPKCVATVVILVWTR
jgi:hypothetical protein